VTRAAVSRGVAIAAATWMAQRRLALVETPQRGLDLLHEAGLPSRSLHHHVKPRSQPAMTAVLMEQSSAGLRRDDDDGNVGA
jgi:hypothetical protein